MVPRFLGFYNGMILQYINILSSSFHALFIIKKSVKILEYIMCKINYIHYKTNIIGNVLVPQEIFKAI